MAPETNAQHQIPLNRRHHPRKLLGEITPHVINQERHIDRGAVVRREHVLGVARVAVAPGVVGEGGDEAGAVVALVEGEG
ncbi:hypothetical protein V498_10058 [Pseudogymnoascus sp. VKM F-4517 (FW-2822)]|nr:hypothetical protein V498_10058 [Pseudogymnoascus sp. VKM F-4517 (FW-2822)]